MYSVYAKTDEKMRIVAVNSDAFITDLKGWVQIDEGEGDRYHAQSRQLPAQIADHRTGHLPLQTGGGCIRKYLEGGSLMLNISAMPGYILIGNQRDFGHTIQFDLTAWADLNADNWVITYTRPGERNISRAWRRVCG